MRTNHDVELIMLCHLLKCLERVNLLQMKRRETNANSFKIIEISLFSLTKQKSTISFEFLPEQIRWLIA
jgi:hypothetical protein